MAQINNNLLIESFKLRQLLSATKLGIFASSAMALILVYVQSAVIAQSVVIGWFLMVLLVAIVRITWVVVVQKTLSKKSHAQIKALLVQFRIGALFAGAAWGIAGYFLFPANHLQYEVFLIFMLAGISVGGVVSLSADIVSATIFSFFILTPVAIRLLLVEDQFSVPMSLSVVLFLGILLFGLRNIHRQIIDNFLLREDANIKDTSIKVGEERYQLLLEHLPMGVFHFDDNFIVTFCNRYLNQVFGDAKYFIVGSDLQDLNNNDMLSSLKKAVSHDETTNYEGVYRLDQTSAEKWIVMVCAPNKDAEGNVSGGIGILQDMTERKMAGKAIEKFALQDYLTELPNRRMLIDRLQQALDNHDAAQSDIALLYIDLDDFKSLNDSLGHAVGDLLLQQVAKRLSKCLRQRDTLARAARIGGDEFVVMLEDLSADPSKAIKQVEAVGNKILAKLNEMFKLAKHEYQCSASIGIALYNPHGGTVDELLRHADLAMYEAKKVGNAIRFYDADMLEVIKSREQLKRALSKAVSNNEFQLFYQIQVDQNRAPIGAEALIRWNRPKHGMVSPAEFIPLAEETDLIMSIGLWVMDTACQKLGEWAQKPLMRDLTISINVSIKQLMTTDFATEIKKSIKRYNINPKLLKIELTESMFLDNSDEVIETIQSLNKIGVGFELDDFGTGYSCLQYLKQLPLNQLKIDQSFVRDINKDKGDQSIVKTIVAMAKGFNIDVIAEGVETKRQYTLLNSYDCQHFQGYYFGKPMPDITFEAELAEMAEAGAAIG